MTRIDIAWNFTPSGIPSFAQDMIKSEIAKGTRKALQKLMDELEPRDEPLENGAVSKNSTFL